MTLHSGAGLTQTDHNCFIHMDGNERPKYLIGVIHRQNTGDRDQPPNCHTGFVTEGTPFAKGHVMALELGGCDQSFNIVPQYERWQGSPGAANGASWRDMELSLRNGQQEVMVVEMDYAAVADSYAANKAAFAGGDNLLHWTGPNIPIRFRVWAVSRATVATYLAADAAGKTAAIGAVITARHGEAPMFEAAINSMPAADREYWKGVMIRRVTLSTHAAYTETTKAAREAAVLQLSINAAGAGHGVGPIRPRSVRHAVRQHQAQPMAQPLPPVPDSYAIWVNTVPAQTEVVNRISQNTANASVGWTAAERLAFNTAEVVRNVFGR